MSFTLLRGTLALTPVSRKAVTWAQPLSELYGSLSRSICPSETPSVACLSPPFPKVFPDLPPLPQQGPKSTLLSPCHRTQNSPQPASFISSPDSDQVQAGKSKLDLTRLDPPQGSPLPSAEKPNSVTVHDKSPSALLPSASTASRPLFSSPLPHGEALCSLRVGDAQALQDACLSKAICFQASSALCPTSPPVLAPDFVPHFILHSSYTFGSSPTSVPAQPGPG